MHIPSATPNGSNERAGMAVKWDFFVNAFDTQRYLPEGRENRNLAYVREFAAAVSILQVRAHSGAVWELLGDHLLSRPCVRQGGS